VSWPGPSALSAWRHRRWGLSVVRLGYSRDHSKPKSLRMRAGAHGTGGALDHDGGMGWPSPLRMLACTPLSHAGRRAVSAHPVEEWNHARSAQVRSGAADARRSRSTGSTA